jgi:tether containing UBX domain for GLUT4
MFLKICFSETLWDVLEFWAEKGEPVYPKANEEGVEAVCIYMREEVVGQAQLEAKTLRSLGLTKGSAIIRYIEDLYQKCFP